ncbi:4-hydroxybenzoate octaprenyltransferase [Avibacterium paragallinarum]|uniref:4-hydroxybenzoate octaprenyltransferase n=1 Tax=Avibacterium paragallinarum TaxID=728 RepID=A0AAE5TGE9_AVIPA|nr:4-hydroxybenzoate octaprenyltransferase [Avibacterium paragallinarum]MEE3609620.1 4-hydroxybenzoate octaprenyltransferase [Avibacterium paragallinarum]MEE3621577.1 4-hydroxybenzoate octaprenyltransferase [Avibacterium paragallinarum]MEE3669318.1 4-hydroxybenzoate octaprenyltransferase [Avibacterium paragallinarum]MEE3681748.1 4-hydroxybenzoate octaprenyltransferase [Avibacterium paragallinarum]MEE4386984.1 4-hydroxybenzoate octaprenyltransferase [Avibacterium paragallinarum]
MPQLSEKLTAYAQLMRFDKPIGTLLLLWPTLWALFLAEKNVPPVSVLLVFVLGVVVMRAAGCVVNDYADRHIDGKVKRTSQRPLATGRVSEKEAKILFASLIFCAFILVLFLNHYAIGLSFIAVLLAFIYPFMKRYTHLPQFFLGAAFGWSIPMAYGALIAYLPLECWLLFLANLAWTVAYDTQYAMVDRDDDLRIGVKSTAILFAQYDNKIIALLQFIALALLVLIGYLAQLHWSYFLLLFSTALFFVYQCKLTRDRRREACFKAFLNNNYVGMGIFLAFLAGIFL